MLRRTEINEKIETDQINEETEIILKHNHWILSPVS